MITKKHKQGKHTPFSDTVLQNALGPVYALYAKIYPFYFNLSIHLSNRLAGISGQQNNLMPGSGGIGGDGGSTP